MNYPLATHIVPLLFAVALISSGEILETLEKMHSDETNSHSKRALNAAISFFKLALKGDKKPNSLRENLSPRRQKRAVATQFRSL
jgi:hypothetical protein